MNLFGTGSYIGERDHGLGSPVERRRSKAMKYDFEMDLR